MWPPSRIPIGIRLKRLRKKPGVGESAQQVGVDGVAVDEAGERADSARDRPGDRDERVPPGVERLAAQGDVGAEERDEDGQLRVQPLPARLDVVPELVHEDEEDEPDAEAPAPDQGVAADRDEDAEELQRAGDLQQHRTGDEDRGEQASPALTRRPRRLLLREPVRRPGAHEPCPIHSSPPT